MTDQRMALFQALEEAILFSPGATSPSLRQALTNQADELSSPEAIPAELRTYGTKVVAHAYKVTNADIEALRTRGYSEEAIFELTLSVALGTGMTCLKHGLAALEGAKHATQDH